MSQTITVQICDQAYDAIRTQAPSSGVSEMQVAADVRERQFRNCAVLTEEQKRVANFADMPILADALEEAGCTDAAILDHCRQPGEHVRGCWVVDLLLGKT
jgi:hypothetical protein